VVCVCKTSSSTLAEKVCAAPAELVLDVMTVMLCTYYKLASTLLRRVVLGEFLGDILWCAGAWRHLCCS
jgi:hypothetical protein